MMINLLLIKIGNRVMVIPYRRRGRENKLKFKKNNNNNNYEK